MRKSVSVISSAGLVALLLAVSSVGWASNFPKTQGLSAKAFIALPAEALSRGSISFRALSVADVHQVPLSPKSALRDLKDQFVMPTGSWVSSISLGGYVNKLDIVRDWSGTKSKWPKRVAMYMVTIRGLVLSSDGPRLLSIGPRKRSATNHEEIFMLDATTGKIVSSFSYR